MPRVPSGQPSDAHIDAQLKVVGAREKLADALEGLAATDDAIGDREGANRARSDAAAQLDKAATEVEHVKVEKAQNSAHGNGAGSALSPKQW
jgi:hypothetical protein